MIDFLQRVDAATFMLLARIFFGLFLAALVSLFYPGFAVLSGSDGPDGSSHQRRERLRFNLGLFIGLSFGLSVAFWVAGALRASADMPPTGCGPGQVPVPLSSERWDDLLEVLLEEPKPIDGEVAEAYRSRIDCSRYYCVNCESERPSAVCVDPVDGKAFEGDVLRLLCPSLPSAP